MKKSILFISSLVILVFLLTGGKILYDGGYFRSIETLIPGDYIMIEGVFGPEDLVADHETGLVYISSDNRRARLRGEDVRGGIYVLNIKDDSPQAERIKLDLPIEFNPHGLSFYKGPLGQKRLFVINHRTNGHFVEIFDVKGKSLKHIESFTGPEMHSPNDIVAVGIRSFYFTNDHGREEGMKRLLGDVFRTGPASIGYFDGKNYRIVAHGLNYANGISLSADGDYILVTETTGKKITAYEREFTTGILKEVFSAFLNSGADNIDLDERGKIWVASHPNLIAFMGHAKKSSKASPSELFSMDFSPEKGFHNITLEFSDKGKLFPGISTGLHYRGKLLLGNVFEPQLMLIDLAKTAK
jgi:arylesterase/paraoxonase